MPSTSPDPDPAAGASQAAAAFAPAALGPLTLRNRIIKAATFEGMSHKGLVGDKLIDFHRSFAAGGVAMTTLAYCAVSREGQGALAGSLEALARATALDGGAALAARAQRERVRLQLN